MNIQELRTQPGLLASLSVIELLSLVGWLVLVEKTKQLYEYVPTLVTLVSHKVGFDVLLSIKNGTNGIQKIRSAREMLYFNVNPVQTLQDDLIKWQVVDTGSMETSASI